MQVKLKIAAFAGIIYLISFLPELIIETIHEFIGISFILIIPFLIGLVLTIPAAIFEILLLLQVSKSPEFKEAT